MKLITLNRYNWDNLEVFININHITAVSEYAYNDVSYTEVYLMGGSIQQVKESPGEVLALIVKSEAES